MPTVKHYFDNRVTSIEFQTAQKPATVGVMEVGDYEFSTSEFETMSVISGMMDVKLPNSEQWQTYQAGETFTVPAHQTFAVKVTVATAYLCLYGSDG